MNVGSRASPDQRHSLQNVEEVQKNKEKNPDAKRMSDILYVTTGFGTQYLGSMDHPKAMGDVMESLIGAVFCDTNHDIAKTYPVCVSGKDSSLHSLPDQVLLP
jgi:dsRNA-specific ribonuclease